MDNTRSPLPESSWLAGLLVLLSLVGFIFVGRWLAAIIVVPAALAAATGLWRHTPWARTAAYAIIGWFALVTAAVGAMAIVMQVNNDPNASTGAIVIFVAAAFVFTLVAASLYRPMFQARVVEATTVG